MQALRVSARRHPEFAWILDSVRVLSGWADEKHVAIQWMWRTAARGRPGEARASAHRHPELVQILDFVGVLSGLQATDCIGAVGRPMRHSRPCSFHDVKQRPPPRCALGRTGFDHSTIGAA